MAPKEEKGDVGQRAGTQAAALREVDAVAQAPALPLVVIQVGRHRGVPVLRPPAAAPGTADEELARPTGHVDGAAIRAQDQVPFSRGHALVLDPCLRSNALVVIGVLDQAHLGDQVGVVDELGRRVAPRDDQVQHGRLVLP